MALVARPEFPMFLAALLLAAQPVPTQSGARPADRAGPTPEEMMNAINRRSPEDEELALIRAAEQHPLGTLDNPIRVGGPVGEHAYLGRLRCPDGAIPHVGPRGEGGVGAFGSITGAYAVSCGASQTRLIFDIYHEEHVEDRAPPGFTLAR
jgi:hypothetical protein